MSLVQFKDLELKYKNNDEATLKKINLSIEEGEFIVVVGPSGCGKSTTLKVLSGLEEITSGELLINEKVVNDLEPRDRDIAMVFQNYALYPHFTVEKNISFGLKKQKLSKNQINERVARVGEMLGITDQFDKMPKDLSGGQQQRVALARAMVKEPLIYIFDEPLSNLDAKLRTKTREEITDLHAELGKTFFYVTHDQVEAMTMADRIIVLSDGHIQQFDTPINIFYNPNNLFVAQFMGSPEINVFNANVKNGDIVLENDFVVEMNDHSKGLIGNRNEVIVGIRPDDIEYAILPKGGFKAIPVVSREILGNTTIVNAKIGEKKLSLVVKTKHYMDEMTEIYVNIPSSICYLFDKESELNLNEAK